MADAPAPSPALEENKPFQTISQQDISTVGFIDKRSQVPLDHRPPDAALNSATSTSTAYSPVESMGTVQLATSAILLNSTTCLPAVTAPPLPAAASTNLMNLIASSLGSQQLQQGPSRLDPSLLQAQIQRTNLSSIGDSFGAVMGQLAAPGAMPLVWTPAHGSHPPTVVPHLTQAEAAVADPKFLHGSLKSGLPPPHPPLQDPSAQDPGANLAPPVPAHLLSAGGGVYQAPPGAGGAAVMGALGPGSCAMGPAAAAMQALQAPALLPAWPLPSLLSAAGANLAAIGRELGLAGAAAGGAPAAPAGALGSAGAGPSAEEKGAPGGEGKVELVCQVCGKVFTEAPNFARHKRRHNCERSFKCPDCPKTFTDSSHLRAHSRKHTGEKPYKCEQCGQCFSQSGQLKIHLRHHTGEKPYVCKVCGKGYSISSSLTKHVRKHTGERPFKCDVCGRAFSVSYHLTEHRRLHTGEKPYVCKLCGKAYGKSGHLHTHMRTHTGERPYKCDICGADFSVSSTLKLHRKKHDKTAPAPADAGMSIAGNLQVLSGEPACLPCANTVMHSGLAPVPAPVPALPGASIAPILAPSQPLARTAPAPPLESALAAAPPPTSSAP